MNLNQLTSRFFAVLMVVLLVFTNISCTDTETTDSTKFVIYYSGMTDIGPSMVGTVSSPTYLGSVPSDFTIINVTLDHEPFTGESFLIDKDNGEISVTNTQNLPVGMYRLSVSCVSNGTRHDFKDVVEVNMMAPVPDGIKVEPNLLKIDYADTKTSDAAAQVTTEGEHVSISKYEIADGEHKDYFAVSGTGELSINKKYTGDIPPGIYSVSLKLTTGAGMGIFENAITFNITSKPLALTYTPNSGKMEEETVGTSTYTSNAPVLRGSLEQVSYRIQKVTAMTDRITAMTDKVSLATDKITIDPTTGALAVASGHGFKAGEKYVVDVNVVNEHAPEGVNFDEVFTLEVVSFIRPIANFTYTNIKKTQSTAFETEHADNFIGDEVSFEWVNLAPALQGQLTIDATTGKISAKKGNAIPLGSYDVTVKASNVKGEQTASFTLTIQENANFFTYIRYGNNLSLPIESHAFQYRVRTADELASLDIPAPFTDIREGVEVEWSLDIKYQMKKTTIDKRTGKLSFATDGFIAANCGMIIVTATTGKGTLEEVAVRVPVFFHFASPVADISVEYTPFVFQVNPRTGGRSVEPVLNGVAGRALNVMTDRTQFLMDYRRNFSYFNINGNESHVDGMLNAKGVDNKVIFMGQVWRNFYGDATPNYGARKPMSYYDNKSATATTLAFVDPAKNLSVVINPNKWMGDDKTFANGAMIGQMTFVTNGAEGGLSNGSPVFPLVVWLDENFK